jgi:outer membrane protein TolC
VDVAQAQTQLETRRAQATDLRIRRAQLEHAVAVLTGQPPAALTIPPSAGVAPRPRSRPRCRRICSSASRHRGIRAARRRRQRAGRCRDGRLFPQLLLAATGATSSRLADWFSLPSRGLAGPPPPVRRRHSPVRPRPFPPGCGRPTKPRWPSTAWTC